MPKSKSNKFKNESQHKSGNTSLPKNFNTYQCRVCKRPHGLKYCRKFLSMTMSERIRTVRRYNYCQNCLAHDHSKGTCFSKYGCRHCKKFHHTLLHIHPKLCRELAPSLSRSRSPSLSRSVTSSANPLGLKSNLKKEVGTISKDDKTPSLSSLLRQNTIIFLPTVLAKLDKHTSYARCLLDSGSVTSRISKRLVSEFRLTTITMKTETICTLTLKSRFDAEAKIECILRVDNRLAMQTPTQSLQRAFTLNFPNLFLADPKFYESAGIDIILGVDIFPKIIREGVFTKPGLPTAQSTIFGWVIYGSSHLS